MLTAVFGEGGTTPTPGDAGGMTKAVVTDEGAVLITGEDAFVVNIGVGTDEEGSVEAVAGSTGVVDGSEVFEHEATKTIKIITTKVAPNHNLFIINPILQLMLTDLSQGYYIIMN